VCQNLKEDDSVMSNHRSHGHYLAQGGDLKKMVAELYGKISGCASGRGGSMHLVDLSVNFLGSTSIVASTIPVATGVAFSNMLKERNHLITTVFFGDGATEEGLFYESVNFAVLHKLPVLFVCENNLYSVCSPLSVRQPSTRKIHKITEAMGMTSVQIDGNDVEKVYMATINAVETIRSGCGPFMIEAMTYRWLEHCGPDFDNNIGYRSEKEFLKWKNRDPIATYEQKLVRKKIITDNFINIEKRKFISEISKAVQLAKVMQFPDPGELKRNVYAQ
jgi:pyruvate dehydrogenase E1 component alpha subunit